MQLFGSHPSPYTRRIRLFVSTNRIECEFKAMNILEKNDREILHTLCPTLQIPVLKDQDQIIWDSKNIFDYLNQKYHLGQELKHPHGNIYTAINAVNDLLVQKLQLKRSAIEVNPKTVLGISLSERETMLFKYLEKCAAQNAFSNWDYLSMSLLSLIDWAQFRNLARFDHLPMIVKATDQWKNLDMARATHPSII